MSRHPPQIRAIRPGEFVATRQTGDHVTIWIEGRDSDEPSVAGTSLSARGIRELIRRLGKQLEAIERRKS